VTISGIARYPRRHPSPAVVARLARCLNREQLAVIPTETQYALTADALSRRAVECVRALKGRVPQQPFSVFLQSMEDLQAWRIRVPHWAECLTDAFWPGPLTLILPTSNPVFRILGGAGSVGVRMSPEPIVRSLLATLKRPLIATSANPSGAVLSLAAENRWLEARAQEASVLWARPGRYRRRSPSTVIDCCGRKPKLLRAGAVPASQWQRVLRDGRAWDRER
jgi:L-threonylcarbamoyladenylate synthase